MLFIRSNVGAQSEGIEGANYARNAIYAEAIGISGWGSINYERKLFIKSNQQFQGRIGLSTLNLRDFTNKLNPDLIVPFALNWLYGKNHNIEIGVGQTISNTVSANSTGDTERGFMLSANFNIGYRYQKPTGGLIIRAGYTPIIEFYNNFLHWGGVSIGYAF